MSKKPKGVTITAEQFAAIQNFAAAFAPKSDEPKTLTELSREHVKQPTRAEAARIETPRIDEGKRKVSNKNVRAFWTDGANAYLRRKKASPAMCERVDEKVRKGEYTHKATTDDVEVYTIADWSNLRRRQVDLADCSAIKLEGYIVRAACKHDYRLYYDAVSEYAYRLKNATSNGVPIPQATAEMILQQSLAYLEQRIFRRGGPSPMTIQAELNKIRKARTGTQIFLRH